MSALRNLLGILILCSLFSASAQPGLYRHYPQPSPTVAIFMGGFPETPLRAQDGGYLLRTGLMVMGFESPGGLAEYYTIKTDSNFIPQWKKKYPHACVLPTGGIILFGHGTIEKVTASGVQVWIKHVSSGMMINDVVSYGNKLRLVGNIRSFIFANQFLYTSDGITLLMDSSGNYMSQQLFHSSVVTTVPFPGGSLRSSANFSKIERDQQGNFFVYSKYRSSNGVESNMAIAKFDTSFTFLWAKTWGTPTHRTFITDIDILPNGRIFASAMTSGNSTNGYSTFAALLKMDAQGNLVQQRFFQNKYDMSALCRKTSGNYVIASSRPDSVFMFETDTTMNISWHNFIAKGSSASGSVIKSNQLFNCLYYGSDPVLISNNLTGNSCASYSIPYSMPTTTITLINFTLNPVTSSVTVSSGTINSIAVQAYNDSCKCPVFIPGLQQNLCANNSLTVNIIGTGNLSWYTSATGNNFIQPGSQFVFSSSIPTVITVYAQDSACGANPNRSAVSVTIHAIPNLTFSPANPTICIGSQIFVSVSGATNYTWSNNSLNTTVQNLNPSNTTNYTVTGSVAPACANTKTMSVTVVPVTTFTVTGPSTVCVGSTATLLASGTSSYTWPGQQQGTTYTISPVNPGTTIYNVTGTNGFCNALRQFTLTALPKPTVSVTVGSPTVCAGQSIPFVATGASSYSWSTGATSATIVPAPFTNTTYIVTGFFGACSASATANITVLNAPIVSLTANSNQVCVGTPVTFSASGALSYTWSNNQTGSTFSIAVPQGITFVSVSASDGTCIAPATASVQGFPQPTLTISSIPNTICYGKPVTLTANGATTYSWSNASTSNNIVLTPFSNTVITVSGTLGLCNGSQTFSLVVKPNPTITVSANKLQLCAGDSVNIVASGAQSYLWSTGSILSSIQQVPVSSQNYSVTGTNTFGCSHTGTITITVFPLPVISLTSNRNPICVGEKTTLNVSGANSYTWMHGPGNGNIVVAPLTVTTYTVKGTDLNGCSSSSFLKLTVEPCTSVSGDLAAATSISVYPNPSTGVFIINTNGLSENNSLDIFTTEGKYLFTKTPAGPQSFIDMGNFSSGLYILKIQGTGKVLKIIVQ